MRSSRGAAMPRALPSQSAEAYMARDGHEDAIAPSVSTTRPMEAGLPSYRCTAAGARCPTMPGGRGNPGTAARQGCEIVSVWPSVSSLNATSTCSPR